MVQVTVYARNIISLFYKQRTFLAKNSILAYISLKIAKLGKIGNDDVIVTSYTGYLYFFGMYGKRSQISIPSSGVYFSSS